MSKTRDRHPERAYRVALMRADEADFITKTSKNELDSNCDCPHLLLFHSSGRRDDGSTWRNCDFLGCGCTQDNGDEPEFKERRESRRRMEAWRTESAETRIKTVFVWGIVIGFMIGVVCMLFMK